MNREEVLEAIASFNGETINWRTEYVALCEKLRDCRARLAQLEDRDVYANTAKELADRIGRVIHLVCEFQSAGRTEFKAWIGYRHKSYAGVLGFTPAFDTIDQLTQYIIDTYCEPQTPATFPVVAEAAVDSESTATV